MLFLNLLTLQSSDFNIIEALQDHFARDQNTRQKTSKEEAVEVLLKPKELFLNYKKAKESSGCVGK